MRKRYPKILAVVIICLLLGAVPEAFPEETGTLSAQESYFVELVNEARLNYLTEESDEELNLEYQDKSFDSAYKVTISTKIYFLNFIDSTTGVEILFNGLLNAELNSNYTADKFILSPDVAYIDPDFSAGYDTEVYYYYYQMDVTLMSSVSSLEKKLVNLFNQARTIPLDIIEVVGLNDYISEFMYNHFSDAETSVKNPLFLNNALNLSARLHAEDMLVRGYLSPVSPEGLTPYDRSLIQGYEQPADVKGMAELTYACTYETEDDGIYNIFKFMFKNELQSAAEEDLTILNTSFFEAGAGVSQGISEGLGGICGDDVMLAEADFGWNYSETYYGGGGLVYEDLNEDGVYQPGEGVEGVRIVVSDTIGMVYDIVTTDSTGSWFYQSTDYPLFDYNFFIQEGQENTENLNSLFFNPYR